MSTFDQTIRSFVIAAASNSHTPGGGSVAALVAALGASMTSMVANLTQGAKFAELEADMQDVVTKMAAAITESEQLLEADMQSFDRYMTALKLPKETDEQKSARSQALQQASVQATEVPLRLATLCREALELSQQIAANANKNVISDLGIAGLLLEAAGHSALLTVDINLPSIKDPAQLDAFTKSRNTLADELTALKDAVVRATRERLS